MHTACLKDLQRLLRQDESEGKEAFQVLGQYNIARSDLVPIIVTYPKETEIVYNARKPHAANQKYCLTALQEGVCCCDFVQNPADECHVLQ